MEEKDEELANQELEGEVAKHPLVKFDADVASAVTFQTDTSSMFRAPSTVNTVASSKLELQLNFLAKQLELEKQRREKLQDEVVTMQRKLE